MSLNHLSKAKSKRLFLEINQISRHLFCSICHEVFEDPVRTACGHTFCYICIENWALVQKKCPICKNTIRTRKLQKDLIACQIIDDYLVKCTHEECEWEGVYSIFKKHQRCCNYKPKKKEVNQMMTEVVELHQNQPITLDSEDNEQECVEDEMEMVIE